MPPDFEVRPGGVRMSNYSKYQQNIIKKYYENRDSIALQRAQEIVTELYLTTGTKRARQWELLKGHLAKLGMKPDQIEHLVQQDNPAVVAQLLQDMLAKAT